MRVLVMAVLLVSLWPSRAADSPDASAGACKPGIYDAAKGIGVQARAPECYSRDEMIRALRDLRSFPVIMASAADSANGTRLFTFNVQSHEGYELLLNAPVIACSRALEIGAVQQCPDPSRLDAYGATRALIVDRYEQAQLMDIEARGARSYSSDANVMFRAQSLTRGQAFVIAKTYKGAAAGSGFRIGSAEASGQRSGYGFIDYTGDGKALLGGR